MKWVAGDLSSGAEDPKSEADHSLLTYAEVKETFVSISTLQYIFMS
jgi:hypothetical protein